MKKRFNKNKECKRCWDMYVLPETLDCILVR